LLPLVSYGVTYEILNQSDISGLDFSQLDQTSEAETRVNNDSSEAVVSYQDSRPSTLSSITALTKDSRTTHTNTQIKVLMVGTGTTGWIAAEE